MFQSQKGTFSVKHGIVYKPDPNLDPDPDL